jgi:hypothetical protein
MASVDDVFNAINAADTKLDLIHSDLGTTNQTLTTIASTTSDGFQAVEGRLDQLIAGQKTTNDLLAHLVGQTDTVICILEHISKNTCTLVNEADAQRRLQERIAEGVEATAFLLKTVYPAAELERHRLGEIERKALECCEKKPTPPPCSYEPCPKPDPLPPPPPPPPVPK